MEISNYIACLSMSMSSAQVAQSADMALLKMAMDTQGSEAQAISDMLPTPSFGQQLDVRV